MGHGEARLERVASFEGLRALACIAVVAFHVRVPGLPGGFIGVDVFFVLSGYLITSLLVAEAARDGTISVRRFWWRRIARLMPALLLMLAAFALVAPLFFPRADVVAEVLLSGLYFSNISRAAVDLPRVTEHTWSLATEMQFYLLWPFLILAIQRFAPRHIFGILIGLFVAATLWRWLQYWNAGWVRAYYAPDTRLSGLALGAALAVTKWRPSAKGQGLVAATAIAVLMLAINRFGFGSDSAMLWGGTVVEVAAGLLILCLRTGEGRFASLLSAPLMVQLGAWSYGLYLWHFPVALLTRTTFDPWVAFLLTLGVSLALAAASHKLVEGPIMRLVRKASPAASSALDRPSRQAT